MASPTTVVFSEQLDGDKVLLSRSSYGFGPSAKMVYTDYDGPRRNLDLLVGPFIAPFGLSRYQGDNTKISVGLRIPQNSPLLAHIEAFDKKVMASFLKMASDPKVNWNVGFMLTPDTVQRLWTPTIQSDAFGYMFRVAVRTTDQGVMRALMLQKVVNDNGQVEISNESHRSTDELLELFKPQSTIYGLVRLKGISISKTAISTKWDAIQLILDGSAAAKEDLVDENLINPIPVELLH